MSIITDGADEDLPRRLNEDEINRVLEAIPYPHAVTRRHAAFAREQILDILREELQQIEITPSGLDELIERVVIQFEESRIKSGAMVGMTAAEAPSQRYQQDTLSAGHSAGKAGMRGTGTAVARIADLVSKQQSKSPSPYNACNVFFTDIQTQHTILRDKKTQMVAINLSALLDIDQTPVIDYHDNLFKMTDRKSSKLPKWYGIYCKIYGVPMPDMTKSSKILRLYLDLKMIVEYRVTVSEIIKALTSSGTNILRFYVSPMSLGIIDVWSLEDQFHSAGFDISGDVDLISFNVLQGFANRGIQNLIVKGIPGIRDVQAANVDIWSMMTLGGQSYVKIRENVFRYNLSSQWQMLFDWERAEKFWTFLDINIVEKDESRYKSWVVLDGSVRGNPPHKIITDEMSKDSTDATNYQKLAVEEGRPIVTRPTTPANASYWGTLWYARTEGSNLREIIVRDDVDARFTISNRPYEVLELFGIIAARRVMLEELYAAFSGGRKEPVYSMRHFSLLADFVCYTGLIRPVSNLAIQGRSTLSKATFSKQFITLVTPAIYGVDETIGDVSASIMIATRAKIGPRAFEYEGGANQGITAEEIKTRLRTSAKSSTEVDKIIASITGVSREADVPLYTVSSGAGGGVERGEGEDEDDEEEYEPAILPPGLEDEEEVSARNKKVLIVDDDDMDDMVNFGEPISSIQQQPSSSKRSRIISPALQDAAKIMGVKIQKAPVVVRSAPEECPAAVVNTRKKTATRSLRFVVDED